MKNNSEKNLPVLLLNTMVLFPSNEIRLELSSLEEKQIISLAEGYYESNILVVFPFINQNHPSTKDLPTVGIIAQIKMRMDMPNGKTRLALYGIRRVQIIDYKEENVGFSANYEEVDIISTSPKEEIACARKILNLLETYIDDYAYNNNLLNNLIGVNSLDRITDLVAPTLPVDYLRKASYIEEVDPVARSKMIMEDINNDLMILELEKKLDEQLSAEIDKNQKEYVLREKIRIIKEELGDINDKDYDIEKIREKINELNCNEKIKNRLISEVHRYETSNSNSPEVGIIRNYIDWLYRGIFIQKIMII